MNASTPPSAQAHLQFAQQFLTSKNFPQAIAELHTAITLDPTFLEAHILLGRLSQDACDLPQAISHYYRALALNPHHRPLHDALLVALHYPGTFSPQHIFTAH